MIQKQRCCAHCPGNLVSSLNRKEHECNVPVYVSGNLKRSSLHKCSPGDAQRSERLKGKPPAERRVQYNKPNMFSLAKKFHAENLQHQPLPDRVDDRVFMNSMRKRRDTECECIRKDVQRCQSIVPEKSSKILKSPKKPYGPELGCKQPESNMDLAICWEIPVNPVYEPRKPIHVDGSNGGAAPSIFTLIRPNPDDSCGCIDQAHVGYSGSENKKCCLCCKVQTTEEVDQQPKPEELPSNENDGNPSHELCKDLDHISISKHVCGKTKEVAAQLGRRSKYSRQLRPCYACDEDKNREPKVRMQSANYLLQRTNCKNDKRNGLPPKGLMVPRPRTPFARRSFCIDTLAPPFSIVSGSRDGDYPEHWRLTSIYQQSYRNPKKQRGTILNYR